MRKVLIGVVVVSLVAAGTALAGGWATVKLSSSPQSMSAGQPWVVEVTVLQHGLATQPLSGLRPTLTIRKTTRVASVAAVDKRPQVVRTFRATETGRPGVYRARVVFPSAGRWRYEVWDGFTEHGGARTHRFAAVKIAPAGT